MKTAFGSRLTLIILFVLAALAPSGALAQKTLEQIVVFGTSLPTPATPSH